MRNKLICLIALLSTGVAFSQDFSNKGKDFWVGYGSHCDMYTGAGAMNPTGGAQEMVLYFATEAVTNITVSIPALGYTQTYTNIAANTIFETPPIPKSSTYDARLGTEGTSNKGIHITSDKPIVSYAHIYNGSRSGATILFPTNTLGKEYYSLNMSQYSQQAYSYCYFFVVATDTGTTTIEVTPSANTQTMTAGTMYTYTLTQGQVFNALGTITGNSGVDLTGTKIVSVAAGNGNCKRIAVFSGSGKINLSCPIGSGGSADNYIVQSFPKTAWGKNYLTVPTYGMPFNYFRIAVSDPTAVVKMNGVTLTGLINNFYYQPAVTNQPNYIQSDKPIMVAQYITTTGACGNTGTIPPNDGDPEVIYLSPIEQNIADVLLYATPHFAITEHFASVLIPNGGTAISSFRIDGTTVAPGSFVVHPQNSSYSYLQYPLSQGTHTIHSDSGFNASVYGYGSFESYGYNAGTNIKDLYQQIGVSTQYGIETTPSVCTNSPFRFKVSLPYQPDSMYWDFHGLASMLPNNNNVMVNGPTPDSITTVNTRTIYWYSLPTFYNITALGTYPITITTYAPNTEGCGTIQTIDFDLLVSTPPVADFTWTAGGCYTEPYQFTETTPQFPKPTYHFWWDFDDPGSGANNISFLRNPVHIFSTPGIHNVRFSDITTPGCLSDTIVHQVNVPPLPSATIASDVTLCINDPQPLITFTGSGGTPPYTFYYHINAGPVQTLSTVGVAVSASIPAPTNVAGTFVYTVDSIRNTGSTLCVQTVSGQTATVIVRPDATITLSSAPGTDNQLVCIDSPIVNIVYTIGGSGNGAVISGGGLPPGVTGVYNAGVYTISGNPTASGVFNYTVRTLGPCMYDSLSGTITVDANSTIALSSAPGTDNQTVCRLSPIVNITYTISGGGTGASISAGGLPAGVTGSYAGGVFTITGTPTVSGVFNYTVKSQGPCVNPSLSGTITVLALPDGNFTYAAPSCETRTVAFTDASVANVGVLNGWSWDFGDPASGAANTSTLQNPIHTFATAGTYNVSLVVTSTSGCTSLVFTRNVVIDARPLAGYIIPEVCLSDTYAQFLDTSKVAPPSTIVAWAWNFGDPVSGPLNTSTLQNPQHSYSAVGPYNVQLIVTSNTGCKDTIVQVLIVNGSFPISSFHVSNPATLCANDSVAIVDQSTVFPGVITQVEIIWDQVNFPGVVQIDPNPFLGKVYRHLYPNFQSPLTKNFTIRFRAYSGGVCLDDSVQVITVNAAPKVQFNNMPDTCLLVAPFQLTQASEVGGVPGSGVYSGPGVSPTGIFSPTVAGVGLHTLLYTFTSTAAGCVDTMSRTIRVLDTAHAVFTYSTPVCDGFPISFTDQSTAPAGVVLSNTVWDMGDGSPIQNHAPGSTFTHVFPSPGSYIVTMFNQSVYGCVSTTYSTTVTVLPNHSIVLSSGAGSDDQTTCINVPIATPITYTLGGGATGAIVTGLPAGMSYTVVGNILTISGAPTTTVGSPFSYSIVTTGNPCTVANAGGRVTVSPDHTIVLSSGAGTNIQRVCLNTPISPIQYTIGGGATSFTIAGLPPGITATQAGNVITLSGAPSSTGGTPYLYTIITSGNNCVKASETGRIDVSPYPVPAFTLDKPAYCIPNAIVGFNNTSTIEDGTENGFIYLWDFGETSSGASNISVAKSPTHWYSGTGPFDVKLTVTSIWGCTHDTTIRITTIHPQPKTDFTTNKPHVCIRDAVTFTDRTDYKDGSPNLWFWNMGDGNTRDIPTFPYTYGDTITYYITLYTQNSFGCNSDTLTKPFIVYPYPTVNAGPDRYILEGGSIKLEAPVATGNDLQYLWTPNLYLDNNTILRPRITRPLTDMTYTLTVTARGGCALSDDVFVKLLKFPVIPNTFTPNNDGINDTWRIDYLNSYPDNRVQVFTRAGQLVFESRGYNTPWDGTLKGKPLTVDTYYYIIEPGSGRDPITGYVAIVK